MIFYYYFLIISGASPFVIQPSLIITFAISLFEGISNMIFVIVSSIMALRPRAPVVRSIAFLATADNASLVNSSSTPSISNNFLYCF